MKKITLCIGILCLLLAMPADLVRGAGDYTLNVVSEGLVQPKIWTNGKLQVLWSEGPFYNRLEFFDATLQTLTENCREGEADLNERGEVAWIERDGRVFLYNGKTKLSIRVAGSDAQNLQINRQGDVAWDAVVEGGERHIYFYDGHITRKLSASGINDDPQLSRTGQVAWTHADLENGIRSDYEVYYFTGQTVLALTDNQREEQHLKMANNGELIWLSALPDSRMSTEVFLYDQHDIQRLTYNDYIDSSAVISPHGQPFWICGDGHDLEIFTLQNGSILQLSNNQYQDIFQSYLSSRYPSYQVFNKTGQFAWIGLTGQVWPWEIFYYDGVNVLQLTSNERLDMYPLLSDNNMVAWTQYAEGYSRSGELHLYKDGFVQRITPTPPIHIQNIPIEITVRGEIIFVEQNSDTREESIWFAVPVVPDGVLEEGGVD